MQIAESALSQPHGIAGRSGQLVSAELHICAPAVLRWAQTGVPIGSKVRSTSIAAPGVGQSLPPPGPSLSGKVPR